MRKILLLLIVLCFFISPIRGQVLYEKSRKLDLYEALKDTVKKTKQEVKFVMKKSPLKAVLLSAALPGAGQYYNESYWKLPLVALAGGYFGYEIINQNNKYLDYKEQYIASQTPENPSGNQALLTSRNFYKDERNRFILYFTVFYVVNLVDAYVDAHLYDFDVSDKVGVTLQPARMEFKIRF